MKDKNNKVPELQAKFYDIKWWNQNVESNLGAVNSGDAFEIASEDSPLATKETSTGQIWYWQVGINPKDGSLGVICSRFPIRD